MSEQKQVPATREETAMSMETGLVVATLPIALQIFFDDGLFKRCGTVAQYISEAEGMPAHLAGKPKTCFAIISRALTWRLDPYAVAMATFTIPGSGQIGYYGSLCQAIIENSGRLVGGVRFEHYGDWGKLRGRFKMGLSDKGKKVPEAVWTDEDEIGLGVKVRAQVKGEPDLRELEFDLVQAYPRNSTLWITDPRTQICYTAVRRFATSVVPALFLGVPFDREDMQDWADALKDVTPARPQLAEFTSPSQSTRARRRAEPAAAEKSAGTETADPLQNSGPASASTESPGGSGPPPPDTGEPAAAGVANGPERKETAEDAEEPLFEFVDQLGEVWQYLDANEAVAAFSDLLEKAQNRPALDALWENGQPFLATLKEAGHEKAIELLTQHYFDLAKGLPAPKAAARETAPPTTAEFDVVVAMPGDMSAQGWFPQAKARLKQMVDRKCPPTDYRRFREANKVALGRLKRELPSWNKIIDQELVKGEQQQLGL